MEKLKKKEIDIKELESVEELLSDTARGKLSEEKEDLQELKRELKEHKEVSLPFRSKSFYDCHW